MGSEALLSGIIPFAGGGMLGNATGFVLKKVLKWMLIIVGFLAGMFFVGVQLLQKYGYVGAVNWDKLANDTSVHIRQTAVLGGFHLMGDVEPTVNELQKADPNYVIPCHCTGWKGTNRIIETMPEKFIQSSVEQLSTFSVPAVSR